MKYKKLVEDRDIFFSGDTMLPDASAKQATHQFLLPLFAKKQITGPTFVSTTSWAQIVVSGRKRCLERIVLCAMNKYHIVRLYAINLAGNRDPSASDGLTRLFLCMPGHVLLHCILSLLTSR